MVALHVVFSPFFHANALLCYYFWKTKNMSFTNESFLPSFCHRVQSFQVYSLLQPLLLVVSTRLAPHSDELVLGMDAFLTVRNKKETSGMNKSNDTENKKKLSKKTLIKWPFYQGRVTQVFCNYCWTNTHHCWEACIWGRTTEIRGRNSTWN